MADENWRANLPREQLVEELERLRSQQSGWRKDKNKFDEQAVEVERLRAESAGLKAESDEWCRMAMATKRELQETQATLKWFEERMKLTDELQSVYAALSESKHEAIVEATSKLFDYDLTKPHDPDELDKHLAGES